METLRDKSTFGNPTRPPATLEEFMLEHEKVIMSFLVHHADIYGNTNQGAAEIANEELAAPPRNSNVTW